MTGPLPKGTKVRIKKGARIRSMHPQRDGVRLAGKSYVVSIHRSSSNPDRVHWAGTGGYWMWCPLEDVEILT